MPVRDKGATMAPQNQSSTLSSNGANHSRVSGLFLGAGVDGETDGTPTTNADYDDLTGTKPDDEDGVTFPAALTAGETSTVSVVVSLPAGLSSARLSCVRACSRMTVRTSRTLVLMA